MNPLKSPDNRVEQQSVAIPSCPAVSQDEYNAWRQEQKTLNRRKFLINGAKVLGGLAVASNILSKFDDDLTRSLYPNNDLEINLVDGAEKLSKGGPELIVADGWGQQRADNAGRELFDALNQSVVVMSVSYPSNLFYPSTVANGIKQVIRQRNIKHLGLVGNSAGGPILLMGYNELQKQQANYIAEGRLNALTLMPGLGFIALNSSPASLSDAIQGDLAEMVADIGEKFGYTPEMVGKFIYALLDGSDATEMTLSVNDNSRFVRHLFDSLAQTFNDCPPQMVWSQLMYFLRYFDFPVQSPDYRAILPSTLDAVYYEPSNLDPIVNKVLAGDHWGDGFSKVNVRSYKKVTLGNTGHADTVAVANAIAQEVASGSVSLIPRRQGS